MLDVIAFILGVVVHLIELTFFSAWYAKYYIQKRERW